MNKEIFKTDTIVHYLLALLALFIPIYPKILPLIIVLILIAWLINLFSNRQVYKGVIDKSLYYLVLLYALYIIGLIYSDNLSYGLKDIETKLSLLIFPIIFSMFIYRKYPVNINLFFVAGCFVGMAFNLAVAGFKFYIEYKELNIINYLHFSYFNLSPIIHPSYFAMYLCLAAALIIKWIRISQFQINKYILPFALFCIILFVFMLSSKAGILTLLTVLFYNAILLIRKRIKIKKALLPALIILLCIASYLLFVPGATSRLEINPELISSYNQIDKDTDDSSEIRVLLWQSAVELINENWFIGVGTGDVKDELMEIYLRNRIKWAEHFQLNAHNQFLQTWAATGIFGLLALLPWLYFLFVRGIKFNYQPMVSLGIIIFINFLFESMLETQAGVIFIAFFCSFFILQYRQINPEKV